jgi:hypothetical protein
MEKICENKSRRKLQIGVIGSSADLNYGEEIEAIAQSVGEEIAKLGAVLVFGAEKDYDSLSSAACRGAKGAGGVTVGVTYNKGKDVFEKDVDIIISTGLDRGGGRELVLCLSCDAMIAIGGGSGTLTEMAIAYQANIPVIVLKGTGGWADKLADTFLDERKRVCFVAAGDAKEAVDIAIKAARR